MRYIDSGQRDPSQTLGTWMKDFDAKSVAELRLQTGFFGIKGITLLLPVFEHLRNTDGLTRCLVGSNDSGTGREDVVALLTELGLPRSGAKLAVCAFGNGFFHPKVVHIRRADGSQTAYVGSANLTESGVLGRHIEAGVLLDTDSGDAADELDRIAAAMDAWFVEDRDGCFPVGDTAAVDDLVSRGILAKAVESDDSRAPARKSAKGEAPTLPKLSPLLTLPPTKSTSPSSSPKSSSSPSPGGTSASGTHAHGAGIGATYFLMELSRNRVSSGSYQADIGKPAFTSFFGGEIGGRVDIRVNTVAVDGSKVARERQLVDVKSHNYRLEIDFPFAYPATDNHRPVVTFRKLSSNEFDCLLLMPDHSGYSKAIDTLASFASKVRAGSMRRATVSGKELSTTWPDCPLL
jgi:hypothetical protein